MKVRGEISMHFTQFFALSQGHIPVVLFKGKCLAHRYKPITGYEKNIDPWVCMESVEKPWLCLEIWCPKIY